LTKIQQPPDVTIAVRYAAKSTADAKGSIPDQLRLTREAAEGEGRAVWEQEFFDEARSAYRGNRGQGLADAQALCERLAGDGHAVELWVLHSNRLARGEGLKPGDAKHLVEYVIWANRAGVKLRSVDDDESVQDRLRAVLAGDQNSGESSNRGINVQRGKRRRAQRGQHTGGPRRTGYVVRREIDADQNVQSRLEIVPDEAAAVREMFLLRGAGVAWREIARTMTRGIAEGGVRPVKGGDLWTYASVRSIVQNPLYAGLMRYEGELLGAGKTWPAIVSEEEWQRAQQPFQSPSGGWRESTGGRPTEVPFLLPKMITCAGCGHGWVRRGSPRPVYRCLGRLEGGPEFCDMPPIPREWIDTSVNDYFEQVGVDLEATAQALLRNADGQLQRTQEQLTQAMRAQATATAALEQTQRDRDAGLLPVDVYLQDRERQAAAADAAAAEAEQLRSRLAELNEEARQLDGADEVQALLGHIRAAVADTIRSPETVAEATRAISQVFSGFTIHPGSPPAGAGWVAMGIGRRTPRFWLEPHLRPDFQPVVLAAQPITSSL
jgi:DNA invertase Pin-like site-specific DNA recombinase